MHKFLIILLLASAHCFGQTADDILNKYYQATGGIDKWSKVNAIKYSGLYTMGPGMQAPVVEIDVAKPFKGTYGDFTWQGMSAKRCMRADSGWSYNPFSGKRETDPLSPNDIRTMKLTADPQGLFYNYKEKGCSLDFLGSDDLDGTDVYKLRLTTKEGDMVYYFIDMQTNYIIKTTTRVKLKDKEEKSATNFSDFRKTDYGIVLPFSTQSVDENGKETDGPVNFTKVEVNGTFDLTVFDKPKGS